MPGGRPVLGTLDATGIITGLMIGAGIFTLPAQVAAQVPDAWHLYALWIAGGVLSLVGALCYAELATSYPDAGGEYAFLRRAWGADCAFLFAWSRAMVTVTGTLAFLAFTYGDYMSRLLPLGSQSSALHAGSAVLVLTALNLAGLRRGSAAQKLLTTCEVLALAAIALAGLFLLEPVPTTTSTVAFDAAAMPAFGLALVFVLFAYGGWNDGAYLSAETRAPATLVRALWLSVVLVTALYVLINLACVRGLGFDAVAGSPTVVTDLLTRALGPRAGLAISIVVAIAMLTSMNATLIVGARSNCALGRDYPLFAWLGRWDTARGTPVTGFLLQAVLTVLLIGVGALTREGLRAMVDYTAPVFWLFFLLVGLGMLKLRRKEPARARPYAVPLYPLLPLVFCVTSAGLLYSSLAYARTGAVAGIGALLLGLAPLAIGRRRPALAGAFALLALGVIACAWPGVRDAVFAALARAIGSVPAQLQ
jgi:basic amino acid/polyamine antiporter, APA family